MPPAAEAATTRCRFLALTLRPVRGAMLARSAVRVVGAGGWWSRGVLVSGDSPQLQERAAIKNGEEEGKAIP